jgi:ribosomal protein L16/L10AE
MGKGKGAVDRVMLYVKKGQILFEIKIKNFKNEVFVHNLLLQCSYKLPLNIKIFYSKQ